MRRSCCRPQDTVSEAVLDEARLSCRSFDTAFDVRATSWTGGPRGHPARRVLKIQFQDDTGRAGAQIRPLRTIASTARQGQGVRRRSASLRSRRLVKGLSRGAVAPLTVRFAVVAGTTRRKPIPYDRPGRRAQAVWPANPAFKGLPAEDHWPNFNESSVLPDHVQEVLGMPSRWRSELGTFIKR